MERRREATLFYPIYFFYSFITLALKLRVTSTWFNGTLAGNHAALLHFEYTNNEQSRLFQFYIPEALRRIFDLSIEHAYVVQRGLFVFLTMVLFHHYLRKWFGIAEAFAGVTVLAALVPLSFLNDLQESSPLLLVTFVAGLWAIREGQDLWLAAILLIGGINNETMLFLPSVYFFYNLRSLDLREVVRVFARGLWVSTPMILVVVSIRYATRNRPHLGGAWHLPDNLEGIARAFSMNPLDYPKAVYLYIFFLFNVFWVYAFLRFREKPLFLQRASLMIPLFIGGHLLTGIILEVRQMVPLAFLLIPMAFFTLFPKPAAESAVEPRRRKSHSAGAR